MTNEGLEPTLWRTCRVLSHAMRLRMLRLLSEDGKACVTQVARQCGLQQASATQHLRLLQSRGLIRAGRHGRWVYYSLKADPLVRHAGEMLAAVAEATSAGTADAVVIQALTAYTHPRRIALVRALARRPLGPTALAAACRMSLPAAFRHLRKLRKRGVVDGDDGTCALSEPASALSKRLLNLALAE